MTVQRSESTRGPRGLSFLFLGLLAGIAGGALVLAVVRSSPSSRSSSALGIPTQDPDLKAVLDSLRALDQRVAQVEVRLSGLEPGASRTPVAPAAGPGGTSDTNAPASNEMAALRAELKLTAQRIEVLENGMKDSGLSWVRNPTAEQLQRARKDVNWALVDEIHQTCRDSYPAGLERVSGMAIEELLEQIGAPTRTGQGTWFYVRPLDPAAPCPDQSGGPAALRPPAPRESHRASQAPWLSQGAGPTDGSRHAA